MLSHLDKMMIPKTIIHQKRGRTFSPHAVAASVYVKIPLSGTRLAAAAAQFSVVSKSLVH